MTHSVQLDLVDFNNRVGAPVGDSPAIRNAQLNADLILEEAIEAAQAITGRRVAVVWDVGSIDKPAEASLAQAIDGLCDLLAVVYGAAVTFGVDLAPFWDEVHRTNIAKAGGPKRADGKQLKPDGWRPPDIDGLLERLHGIPREEKS